MGRRPRSRSGVPAHVGQTQAALLRMRRVGGGLLVGYHGVPLAEEVLERQQRRSAHAQGAAGAQLAAVVGQGALRRGRAEGRGQQGVPEERESVVRG